MPRGTRRIAWCLFALVVACGAGSPTETSSPVTQERPLESDPVPSAHPEAAINVVASRYGHVEVHVDARASCTIAVEVDQGEFGDGPPKASLAPTPEAVGRLVWDYPAPLVPAGRGRHDIKCAAATGWSEVVSEFETQARALDPKAFRVRLEAVDPLVGLPNVRAALDPSLVPARDSVMRRLEDGLEDEWRSATRGLGSLQLVTSSADVAIAVLPARGGSVLVSVGDGTKRVFLFAQDERGRTLAGEGATAALHELGHLWCCHDTASTPDGHWLERIPDPRLHGINRYGLMTNPVSCRLGRGFEVCATRFSDRELAAMGFSDLPAPSEDSCGAQVDALDAQIRDMEAALAAARSQVDAEADELRAAVRGLVAIEAQYPSLAMPPDMRARYEALSSEQNVLAARYDAHRAAYNAIVSARNEVASQLNATRC